MSNTSFKLMAYIMSAIDFVNPKIDKRVQTFGITQGMTVVDYGCGPGRYTTRYSKLVGSKGKVYAIDIQELALKTVQKKTEKLHLTNVEMRPVHGYNSGLPDHVADMVTALDMFFAVPDPTQFLREIRRITKADGLLILDDGHQSRNATKRKIEASDAWEIIAETPDHLTLRPK